MSMDVMNRSVFSSRANWWFDLWQAINSEREEKIPITSSFNYPGIAGQNSNTEGSGHHQLPINQGAVDKSKTFRDQGKAKNTKVKKHCGFCQKNGELEEFYKSHHLKDRAGNIVCPILSKYTCPSCGATGKKAHTIRHCPLNANYAKMLDLTLSLRRNAVGRIRVQPSSSN